MPVEPKFRVKCIIPRYFNKCHIKKRFTSVWSTQSIVLPTMPKWLMRAGLYLDLQPAREQNAKTSDGARHISVLLQYFCPITIVYWRKELKYRCALVAKVFKYELRTQAQGTSQDADTNFGQVGSANFCAKCGIITKVVSKNSWGKPHF